MNAGLHAGQDTFTVLQLFRRPNAASFSIERLYEDVRNHLPAEIRARVMVNRFGSRGVIRRVYDAIRAGLQRADVFHVTGDVHYLTYFLRRRKTVLTIHDCIPLDRHSGIRFWLLWLLWYWLPEKRCAAIAVVSEATRDRLLHYLDCDPNKVRVIHNNVSDEFQPHPAEFNAVTPRILHVGTPENKNLERHAAALAGLDCRLVIVGELSSRQRRALSDAAVPFENHVGLSRADLLGQYVRCDMLLFASTYEGFGLPIVEAQAVGRPVVTSNILAMPEVAGGAACLVDPFDIGSIRGGVMRVIHDPGYRASLVRDGLLNAERFRIEKIAGQYASLYRDVARCVRAA